MLNDWMFQLKSAYPQFSQLNPKVTHNLLLEKIEWMGVRGVAKQWSSYLKGRTQIVITEYVTFKNKENKQNIKKKYYLNRRIYNFVIFF